MKRPGQIVLFRFPQVDLISGKLRPALLIQRAPGPHEDWLIYMISSQAHQFVPEFDEIVEEDSEDFAGSGLKVRSVIRIGRLAVVDGAVFLGALGEISVERLHGIKSRLVAWLMQN